MELSIVIPVYKSKEILPNLIEEIDKVLNAKLSKFDMIDDNIYIVQRVKDFFNEI